ncbi:HU family DNA-binding protein [Pseudomonas sp.]|uniref:HU family DNA-binding protein n=1 Tax=Pseudomonas sp. TaxID=306 RepID=UPI003FD7F0FC
MNKQELIDAIAEHADLSKTAVGAVLASLAAVTSNALEDGKEVTLHGLGKLKPTHRKARAGRNPSTGQRVDIPAQNGVKFVIGKFLKDDLN